MIEMIRKYSFHMPYIGISLTLMGVVVGIFGVAGAVGSIVGCSLGLMVGDLLGQEKAEGGPGK